MKRRKLLHLVCALATFVVAWLVTSPAWAMTASAPVCDPRGAITFAPPPQIQDEERSIDIPADCFTIEVNPFDTRNVVPGRSALDFSSAQEPVAVTSTLDVPLYLAGRLSVPLTSTPPPPSGVQLSLDRPPRV